MLQITTPDFSFPDFTSWLDAQMKAIDIGNASSVDREKWINYSTALFAYYEYQRASNEASAKLSQSLD